MENREEIRTLESNEIEIVSGAGFWEWIGVGLEWMSEESPEL